MAWAGSDRASRLPSDWPRRRTRVLARDAGICQLGDPGCTVTATEVDHVVHGDDHSLTNLQAVCTRCHAAKSAREGAYARHGNRALRLRPSERHPGAVGGGG